MPILALVVMAILNGVQEAISKHDHIGVQEWVQVGLQALMAFNVWATANLPQYGKMKTYVAAAIAIFSLLYTVLDGGISSQEWINLIITGVAAVGVGVIPQPVTTVLNGRTVLPQERMNAPV